MKQCLLVDGKNLAYRAHFKHSALSSYGRPTSVLFGATNMLLSLQRKFNIPMAIVWDGAGKTWRHELTKGREKEYKANRKFNKIRSIVNSQIPTFKELWSTMGIQNFEIPRLEADDLIGIIASYLTQGFYDKVIIYSGDRDFLQLVSDKIVVYAAQGRSGFKGRILTEDDVEKQWGVKGKDYIKMRALCGDKGDNIGKIFNKLGPKTAVKILKNGLDPSVKNFNKFSMTTFNLYSDKFAPIWDLVYDNYHLCKIRTNWFDKRLDKETQSKVKKILDQIYHYGVTRKNWDNTKYRKTLELLVNFELDEIYDRMQEICRLP